MSITKARAVTTIGAAARRAGVNIETIRYYEREGVVPKPARAANGRRIYGDAEIDRLAFVRRGRELGFTLGEIRALARLAAGPSIACDEVLAMTRAHLVEVRLKMRDLARLETVLARLAGQCARGRPRACPVIDALAGHAT
jgi:MerR family transcriptional regulator, mercuric resistance operon regulatory protein